MQFFMRWGVSAPREQPYLRLAIIVENNTNHFLTAPWGQAWPPLCSYPPFWDKPLNKGELGEVGNWVEVDLSSDLEYKLLKRRRERRRKRRRKGRRKSVRQNKESLKAAVSLAEQTKLPCQPRSQNAIPSLGYFSEDVLFSTFVAWY